MRRGKRSAARASASGILEGVPVGTHIRAPAGTSNDVQRSRKSPPSGLVVAPAFQLQPEYRERTFGGLPAIQLRESA
jgi:hypothetical protein